MGIAKVTRNYQVTVPKDVRRVQDIKVGDTVFFAIEGEKIDFFKMNRENVVRETAGIWKGKIKGSSIGYVRAIRREWASRTKRAGL